MKYIEIGYGNDTFVNTEVEDGDCEYRCPGVVSFERFVDIYVRIWIGRTVWILSLRDGFKKTAKDRLAFKVVLGIAGE